MIILTVKVLGFTLFTITSQIWEEKFQWKVKLMRELHLRLPLMIDIPQNLKSYGRQELQSFTQRLVKKLHESGNEFIELFKHGTLSVEIHKPVKVAKQTPHTRDKMYIISSGS